MMRYLKKLCLCVIILGLLGSCAFASELHIPSAALNGQPVAHQATDVQYLFDINKDTVASYCYTNFDLLKGPIKGVAVDFQGFGYSTMKSEPNPIDTALAEANILVIQPFLNPWNWMNFFAVNQTNEIIAAVLDKHWLAEDIPLVIYGRSMGGISVYSYALYGNFHVKGVAANCPVTDLHSHATERPDLPRGLYSAYAGYDGGAEMGIYLHCAMCHLDRLPKVPYLVISSDADTRVSKALHSMPFVNGMKELGYNVEYLDVPGMSHVQFDGGNFDSHPEVLQKYIDFIIGCIG